MPITIQELIASDTISQAVDKINFNFDQLLLNGGGPVGPSGPAGPTGPVGGRGLPGATWYHDPGTTPGTDPNTLIFPNVEEDDYYLQANGAVWQYNGVLWILTTVNLQGPVGPSGSSFGFNYAGGYPGAASINNQNVAYPAPMPGGTSAGASQGTNEGVSVALFGGVASTAIPPSGISFTSGFLIPDVMIKSLDSSLVSVFIHQKDSAAAAIKFMGGGAVPGDKYEQLTFNDLSEISLGIDDTLNINVPKPATSPLSLSDLIGFNVNTLYRGQQYFSGKQINFVSGADSNPSGLGSEISDVSFVINTSNISIPAKFSVSTTYATASAAFQIGGNITIPTTPTTKTGTVLADANNITLWGNNVVLAERTNNRIRIDSGGIDIRSNNGLVTLFSTPGVQIGSAGNTIINGNLGVIVGVPGTQILLNTTSTGIIELESYLAGQSIKIDNASPGNTGAINMKGNVTWGATAYSSPLPVAFKHISISGDGIAVNKAPIWVQRQHNPASLGTYSMMRFQKLVGTQAVEDVAINTSSIAIQNSSGVAGFIGFEIQNTQAGQDVGFKLAGVDSVSGFKTRFHASEDTTAVSNRFQYVRRTLLIDPLTAGINDPGPVAQYTVPASYMDASFLDIVIAGQSGAAGVNVSDNTIQINIPDGLYSGQRLNLHVVVMPARRYDSGTATQHNWPTAGLSGTAVINLNTFATQAFQTDQVLASVECSNWSAAPPYVGEFFAELLWIGQTYTSYFITNSSTSAMSGIRGWAVTNVLSPTIVSASPTNTEAQMKANFIITP